MDLENVIDIEVENVSDGIDTENVDDFEIEVQESGPQGEQGPPGLSAYEIYSTHGGTLSEADWLESLKGETGDPGHTPVKGEDYFTDDDIATLAIPRKTSEVENDSGFIAEIPDEYAKKTYVDDAIANSGGASNNKGLYVLDIPNFNDGGIYYDGDNNTNTPAILAKISEAITTAKNDGYDYPTFIIIGKRNPTIYECKQNYDTQIDFTSVINTNNENNIGVTTGLTNSKMTVLGTWTDGVFTCVRINGNKKSRHMLTNSDVLTKTNTTSFTPTSDYHPATKKYVDDSSASVPKIYVDGDVFQSVRSFNYPSGSRWLNADDNFENNAKALFKKYRTKLLEAFDITSATCNYSTSYKYPINLRFVLQSDDTHATMEEYTSQVDYVCEMVHPESSSKIIKYVLPVTFKYDSSGNFTGTFSTQMTITTRQYLSTTNTISYTPSADYHPSTKKYVDDSIKAAIATALEGEY